MPRTKLSGNEICGFADHDLGGLRRARKSTRSYWSQFSGGTRGRRQAGLAIRDGLAAALIQISWHGYQYCAYAKHGDNTRFPGVGRAGARAENS